MNDPTHTIQRLADELGIKVWRVHGGWAIEGEPGPLSPADAKFVLQSFKADRWRLGA